MESCKYRLYKPQIRKIDKKWCSIGINVFKVGPFADFSANFSGMKILTHFLKPSAYNRHTEPERKFQLGQKFAMLSRTYTVALSIKSKCVPLRF